MKLVEDIFADRSQAVMSHRAAYEAALSRDLEYARLQRRIQEEGLKLMGLAVREEQSEELAQSIRLLTQERDALVKTKNLQPFLCPVCEDRGSVDGEVCVCRRRDIYQEHYEAPDPRSFPRGIRRYPTDRIDDTKKLDGLGATARSLTKLALRAASRILKAYPKVAPGMLVSGKTGTGKSTLAKAIAKSADEAGVDVLYLSAVQVNELYYQQRMGAPINVRYLETSWLLIIDDLGTEPLTNNVTVPALYNILEERANLRRPAIFLTNVDNSGLRERYGERISSRLCDEGQYIPVPLGGTDLRTGAAD